MEHPYEREFLQTLQQLVLDERVNLKTLIYNLTSNLTDDDLDLLYEYANRERIFANSSDDETALKVWIFENMIQT